MTLKMAFGVTWFLQDSGSLDDLMLQSNVYVSCSKCMLHVASVCYMLQVYCMDPETKCKSIVGLFFCVYVCVRVCIYVYIYTCRYICGENLEVCSVNVRVCSDVCLSVPRHDVCRLNLTYLHVQTQNT